MILINVILDHILRHLQQILDSVHKNMDELSHLEYADE